MCFGFLILVVLIDCMISVPLLLDVIQMSVSTVSFFAMLNSLWPSLPLECFPLTNDLNSLSLELIRHLLSLGIF